MASGTTNSESPPVSPPAGLDPHGLAVDLLDPGMDATSLGDRFTILSISVVYRGRAIPVAWKVLHANVPHPWKPEWVALLRVFAGLVPPGWTVMVMSDRALLPAGFTGRSWPWAGTP